MSIFSHDKIIEADVRNGPFTTIASQYILGRHSPQLLAAIKTTPCLVYLQAMMGGNSLIGRELYPLLVSAGFQDCSVSPRMVYADASRPELVDGFTKKTFTAMVEGVREEAIRNGLISEEEWTKGIADLYHTAESDGTFCYTVFKAVGGKFR